MRAVRLPTDTIVASPAPPAPGSVAPPRPATRTTSGIRLAAKVVAPPPSAQSYEDEIDDDDILEVTPIRPSVPVPSPILGAGVLGSILARCRYLVADVRTAWQAAAAGAKALQLELVTRAVVVHLADSRGTELRVVGVRGSGTESLLGTTWNAEDPLVALILHRKAPLALPLAPRASRGSARLAAIRGERLVVLVPLLEEGRVVAMIELVDPDPRHDRQVIAAAELVLRVLSPFVTTKRRSA